MSLTYGERGRGTGPFGTLLANWTRRGMIVGVQSNTIDLAAATTNFSTITAVNVANTILFYNGRTQNNAAGTTGQSYPRITLTNSTTVTAVRGVAQAGAMPVAWSLVEFVPGILRSCQYNTVPLAGATSQTTTLATTLQADFATKATLIHLGFSTTAVTALDPTFEVKQVLTNATTVTATILAGNNATTSSFVVVEFF